MVLIHNSSIQSQISARRAFVSRALHGHSWGNLKHQIYLGNQKFVERHIQSLGSETGRLSEIPLKQRRMIAKSLQAYREENDYKDESIIAAHLSGSYTMKELADYFGCHYSSVSRAIARHDASARN